MRKNVRTFDQNSPYDSPWSLRQRLVMVIWSISWRLCCSWTPKPFNPWRIWILQRFGAKIHGKPFVHQHARITLPWNLTLYDRACLGDASHAYCLGTIAIHQGATVAQEVYLCTGTHDFNHPSKPLQTSPIVVEDDSFVGARAFVLPGVTIGRGAVVGACSVVTRDVAPRSYVAGNPARLIR